MLQPNLFEQEGEEDIVMHYVHDFWNRMVALKKIDLEHSGKRKKVVAVDSLSHSNVREIGSRHNFHQS